MDIGLPDIDDLSLTRLIRAQHPTLPIIAVTANAMPDDRERCLAAGCTDYISKPFSFLAMVAVLQGYRQELSSTDQR